MEKSRSVHSPVIPTVMEARFSPSPSASSTSGGEKQEKEREAEMEGKQLNRRESQEGAKSKEAIQGGPHFTTGRTSIPLTRASSISAKQNRFSFKQDISHLPVVWAGLGIGSVFTQFKVSRIQGPPTLPHLPFSALETHCQKDSLFKRTDGGPRSHSLLLVPFMSV